MTASVPYRLFLFEFISAAAAAGAAVSPKLLSEGQAMFHAVAQDLQHIPWIVVTTINTTREKDFKEAACAADLCLVIAPETDGILQQYASWAIESGAKLLGPTPTAIHLTGDKLLLAEHFRKFKIPHPQTRILEAGMEQDYPLIIKPRDGAGSEATAVIHSAEEKRKYEEKHPNCLNKCTLIQKYIRGYPVSVSFLIGAQRRCSLIPTEQLFEYHDFIRYKGGKIPLKCDLHKRAIDLAAKSLNTIAGLFGYVGVDLVLGREEKDDVVIEVNPRLTTSYVGLRCLAKGNIAEALVRICLDKPVAEFSWLPYVIYFDVEGRIIQNQT